MAPAGQRDYSNARLTRHALGRFAERFGVEPGEADRDLRVALSRTRRLGRNARNDAVALLALHRGRALVAILQGSTCLTVLTWPQFAPHLGEFGRPRLPRKWGRLLRRLVAPQLENMTETESSENDMKEWVDGKNCGEYGEDGADDVRYP